MEPPLEFDWVRQASSATRQIKQFALDGPVASNFLPRLRACVRSCYPLIARLAENKPLECPNHSGELDLFRAVDMLVSSKVTTKGPLAERNSTEVKELAGSSALSFPSPVKFSPSAPSVSSLSASPLSLRGQLSPASFTPCLPHHSSAHQLEQQVPDSRVPGLKSPSFSISEESSSFVLPGWSNDSTRGSHGGSSDGWSVPAFADHANPLRDRWSFDSESFGFHRERVTSRSSGSSSFDLQTCGICAKLLNELLVAVLVCGHVFHAECLENMTTEINRYDPACPVCTFGEKQALKIYEKAKAKMELKARKRFRNRIVDSDISGNLAHFEHQKSSAHEGGCPRMSSSSSMKRSLKRPFLRHYFSFGSKGSRSYSESLSNRKRGFSWTRSNKK